MKQTCILLVKGRSKDTYKRKKRVNLKRSASREWKWESQIRKTVLKNKTVLKDNTHRELPEYQVFC